MDKNELEYYIQKRMVYAYQLEHLDIPRDEMLVLNQLINEIDGYLVILLPSTSTMH